VDVDETSLKQLKAIPDTTKIFFPAFDPENPACPDEGATATIDIAEIVSHVHNLESGETDAIIICCGLGGSMTDIVPHVIASLRSSIVDPIFGLVTLPCLAEGQKRSAKAADDIDLLSPLLDGMILFDNETWYKKTRVEFAAAAKREKSFVQRLGFGKDEPEISPVLATYNLLNEAIVRRISLILKAGEFRADGGIDLAEVVLDSGEVLNTMKGMGFITIGYAVERLQSNPLAFLSFIKPDGMFSEEKKRKASRIIDLAKQAIYHEISTPCDMTSAHKALILVAGPTHELSMQGFMTVRKWIDRSIRGLETRSGDYPVMNTKNVAIIVMLSGLENIPRITELREIRGLSGHGSFVAASPGDIWDTPPLMSRDTVMPREQMISLPSKIQKPAIRSRPDEEELGSPEQLHAQTEPAAPQQPIQKPKLPVQQPLQVHAAPHPHESAQTPQVKDIESPHQGVTGGERDSLGPTETPNHTVIHSEHETRTAKLTISRGPPPDIPSRHGAPAKAHAKDVARQRIEQELQRQRMMALSGNSRKPHEHTSTPRTPSTEIIRPRREIIRKTTPEPSSSREQPLPEPETTTEPPKKTVIIRKRSLSVQEDSAETPPRTDMDQAGNSQVMNSIPELFTPGPFPAAEPEPEPVEIKEQHYKAKDEIFLGKNIRGIQIPRVRDQSLQRTNIKSKKNVEPEDRDEDENASSSEIGELSGTQSQGKKRKKTG
jgi:cell division GTPase FtsZ